MFGNPQAHEQQVRQYFENFVSANRERLSDQLSDSASLVDWDINVHGKEVVLHAFDSIWSSLTDISVAVEHMDFVGGKAYCTIIIAAAEIPEALHVLDVIGFDDNNKIDSITAYKR